MRKMLILTALCVACLTSLAFAADTKCSMLQIPESGCKCEQCVTCTKTDDCGHCQEVAHSVEGCGTIPVAQEECRTIDPACAPGSQFCLLDASRAQYSMCCLGECYTILNKDRKDLCPKCNDDCGCKEKSCGCKKNDCGCKKQSCGCEKQSCGCEKKCQSCTGECNCYQPYTGYTPIPAPEPVRGPAPYVYIPVETPERMVPPVEVEVPIKVEGRG